MVVQGYFLKLDYNGHEEVYAGLNEIVDPNDVARVIDEARFRALDG